MRTVDWVDGRVQMIDQKQIPWKLEIVYFDDYKAVAAG
ncbi:MAG: S-methyl-5-thioribose-1-phosphate isomerase, partial [Chloroflexi bacterium]